jgi:hypothetical protein
MGFSSPPWYAAQRHPRRVPDCASAQQGKQYHIAAPGAKEARWARMAGWGPSPLPLYPMVFLVLLVLLRGDRT